MKKKIMKATSLMLATLLLVFALPVSAFAEIVVQSTSIQNNQQIAEDEAPILETSNLFNKGLAGLEKEPQGSAVSRTLEAPSQPTAVAEGDGETKDKPSILPFAVMNGYAVSGDLTGLYNTLKDALVAVNGDAGSNYTITLSDNDMAMGGTGFIDSGKNVILTSDSNGPYTIMQKIATRHLEVYGSLTLENIILEGNSASGPGGGIKVDAGSLTVNGGAVITECYQIGSGGGVEAINNSHILMNAGEISKNTTQTLNGMGGGISLNKSHFIMKDGVIIDNLSDWGGGVDAGLESTFTMDNGLIDHNETRNTLSGGGGGGVHVYVHSLFTMNDGYITNNISGYLGGGIYAAQSTHLGSEPDDWCKVIINNGTISDNTAVYGGGVGAQFNGQIEMKGGLITRNKAYSGGGAVIAKAIHEDAGVYFKVLGGEISHNEATKLGGGIWATDQSSYIIELTVGTANSSTRPRIFENTAGNDGGGIMLDGYDDNVRATIHAGEIFSNTADQYGGGICVSGNSELSMTGGIIGGSDNSHKNVASLGGGIATKNGAGTGNRVNVTGGQIRHNEATSTTGGGGGAYISTNDRAEFMNIISDNNADSNSGGGIYIEDDATLLLKDIVMERNHATNDGGGVYSAPFGNVAVKDDSFIVENTADSDGGGIYTEDFNDYANLTLADYQNLEVDATVDFQKNSAATCYLPPAIVASYSNIEFASTSIMVDEENYLHPINNYDINFKSNRALGYYQVVYDANGGAGAHDSTIVVGYGCTVLDNTQAGISREGYTFMGWSSDGSDTLSYKGSGNETIGTTAVDDEIITLYAIWKSNKKPFKPDIEKPVKPTTNGGTETNLEKKQVLPQTGANQVISYGVVFLGLILLGLGVSKKKFNK